MPALLPVLRRTTSPAQALLVGQERPDLQLVRRPFAPWLHQVLVEDRDDRIRYVQRADLQRWGLTEEQAWSAAREALGHRAHEPVTFEDGRVRVREWGGFASSLVVLPGWWKAVTEHLGGEVVALAPDVDDLVVMREDDPLLDDALRWAFDTFRTADRPLSPAPLHDPRGYRRNLRLLEAFGYAEQDEVLLQTAPDGVYIAELQLRLVDGQAVSRTVVDAAYPCWLPVADEIQFPDGVRPFDPTLPVVPGVEPVRHRWTPVDDRRPE